MYLKYRPIIQHPDGWRPSITTFDMIVLPTSRWITALKANQVGLRLLVGSLPPDLARSHEPKESLFRKNLQPFRVSGGMFYS